MTLTLTALILTAGICSVIASLLSSWRMQGPAVLALAGQMRNSRQISRAHAVVNAPVTNGRGVNRHAVAVRFADIRLGYYPDAQLAAG